MSNRAKTPQHGAYQLFEDVMNLVGSFAKLGKTVATSKIQSTADAANSFIQSKSELPDLKAQLTSAAESLETISNYAVHTDVKHMVDDVGVFARKHPVTALISVVAAGAVISRLMRKNPVATKATKRAAPKTKAKKAAAKPRRPANGTAQTHA